MRLITDQQAALGAAQRRSRAAAAQLWLLGSPAYRKERVGELDRLDLTEDVDVARLALTGATPVVRNQEGNT